MTTTTYTILLSIEDALDDIPTPREVQIVVEAAVRNQGLARADGESKGLARADVFVGDHLKADLPAGKMAKAKLAHKDMRN